MKRWLYPLFWILLGIGLSAIFFLISSPPRGTAVKLLPPPTPAPIIVDIHGAVNHPGVYALPQNSRVKDVIDAAGGMTADSNGDAVNLAARLKDGDKITIPVEGTTLEVDPTAEPVQEYAERSPEVEISPSGGMININNATADELATLPGIGPSLAEKIILQRESRGYFKTIEEIMDVSGIGPSKFEQMKDRITVE